jgi:hypothetical protein
MKCGSSHCIVVKPYFVLLRSNEFYSLCVFFLLAGECSTYISSVISIVRSNDCSIDPEEPTRSDGDGSDGVIVDVDGGGGGFLPPETGAVVGSSAYGADIGTRAAAVAGSMLAVLAAVSSIMWALNQFKPGLFGGAGSGSGAGAGAAAASGGNGGAAGAEFEMIRSTSNGSAAAAPASQTTPLLAASNARGAANGFGPPSDEAPLMQSVNLANYFAPMPSTAATPSAPSRTGTMTKGIQTDFDDGGADYFHVESASAAAAAPVSRSRDHLLFDMASGDTFNVGTQTGPPPGYLTSVAGGGGGASTLKYSYESRQVTGNAGGLASQV